jgi:hypothetical protein
MQLFGMIWILNKLIRQKRSSTVQAPIIVAQAGRLTLREPRRLRGN